MASSLMISLSISAATFPCDRHRLRHSTISLSLSSSSSAQTEPDEPTPGSWRSMEGLLRCSANYAPLTPISFLDRSAKVFPDRTALVYQPPSSGPTVQRTWRETHQRCLQLASALIRHLRVSPGEIALIALLGRYDVSGRT